jgi:hypothetical protein
MLADTTPNSSAISPCALGNADHGLDQDVITYCSVAELASPVAVSPDEAPVVSAHRPGIADTAFINQSTANFGKRVCSTVAHTWKVNIHL